MPENADHPTSPERVELRLDSRGRDRLASLRALVPEAFPEGQLDIDRLQAAVESTPDDSTERYGLSWAGKSEAVRAVQHQTVATLTPNIARSIGFDSAKHVLIEGDNLEVLRLLQRGYNDQVKLIYVDPPYNTGKDFVYKDDFHDGLAAYLRMTAQVGSDGNRLSSNSETSGRYHSAWLSMIYPRLSLARNLLTQDGFVVVSIDDAELANLRLVMDEVFGVENFVACLVWDRNRKNDAKLFSVGHEYMLVYARNLVHIRSIGTVLRAQKPGIDDVRVEYERLRSELGDDHDAVRDGLLTFYKTWPDDDPRRPLARFRKVDGRGPFRDDRDISWPGGGGPKYDVIHPITGEPCKLPKRGWVYSEDRMAEEMEAGAVVFGVDHTTVPTLRSDLFESDVQALSSVRFSYAQTAAQHFDALFQDERVFDNPKHYVDLASLIEYMTGPDDLILDFFAGSGSTAHAVLHLNSRDGTDRRYMCVQLPEPVNTTKTSGQNAVAMGFHTIMYICRERIVRSSAKEYGDTQPPGFRFYELAVSNFKHWDAIQGSDATENLAGAIMAIADNLAGTATDGGILSEILVKEGVPLDVSIERHELAGASVVVAGRSVAVCLSRKATDEQVEALVALKVPRVVMLEVAFNGNDEVKSNAFYSLRDAGIVMRTA